MNCPVNETDSNSFVISSRKIIIKIRRVLKIKVIVRCNFFSPYRKQDLKMLTVYTVNYFISAFHILKGRINFSKLLLVSGFWLLISTNGLGQPGVCTNPRVDISFYDNNNEVKTYAIDLCQSMGSGGWEDDIDIMTGYLNAPSPRSIQWYYSNCK